MSRKKYVEKLQVRQDSSIYETLVAFLKKLLLAESAVFFLSTFFDLNKPIIKGLIYILVIRKNGFSIII